MNISRREFLQMLAAASLAGCAVPGTEKINRSYSKDMYDVPPKGNVSLLHFTDCHAQLMPVWFREPNINIGVGVMNNRPPHLVGEHHLKYYGVEAGSAEANAFTYIDFVEASKQYGKIGGFAHMATLIKQLRAQRPGSLLLDGGDTWQGSATSLWTNAQDMVDACKLLGVDVMTGHWEFTFGAERVKEIINNDLKGKIDFLAQNIIDNEWEEAVFKPYTIKEINGVNVAIIGQAFPYTPIANPRFMVPDWSFGIREDTMQKYVNKARKEGAQVVVVLSHNGMDVDIKMLFLAVIPMTQYLSHSKLKILKATKLWLSTLDRTLNSSPCWILMFKTAKLKITISIYYQYFQTYYLQILKWMLILKKFVNLSKPI